MRVARYPLVVVVASLLAALASSCRGEGRRAPPVSAHVAGTPRSRRATHPSNHLGARDTGSVAGSVAGTIAVAPSLAARAAGDVLFVIARSSADRQIVAVRREDGVTFPFQFKISGADAMIAGTPFAGPLDITARLSRSGDAVAAKGDVEGVARGVAVGAADVEVTLDTVRE